jgi:hypothetical protein
MLHFFDRLVWTMCWRVRSRSTAMPDLARGPSGIYIGARGSAPIPRLSLPDRGACLFACAALQRGRHAPDCRLHRGQPGASPVPPLSRVPIITVAQCAGRRRFADVAAQVGGRGAYHAREPISSTG